MTSHFDGPDSFVGDLLSCARCGGDHVKLQWIRFERPIIDDDGTTWKYWSSCPANGDPVLLRQIDENFFADEVVRTFKDE